MWRVAPITKLRVLQSGRKEKPHNSSSTGDAKHNVIRKCIHSSGTWSCEQPGLSIKTAQHIVSSRVPPGKLVGGGVLL